MSVLMFAAIVSACARLLTMLHSVSSDVQPSRSPVPTSVSVEDMVGLKATSEMILIGFAVVSCGSPIGARLQGEMSFRFARSTDVLFFSCLAGFGSSASCFADKGGADAGVAVSSAGVISANAMLFD